MEGFLSSNMDYISIRPSEDDILQLALFQPDDNEIYKQADQILKKEKKKFFFKWTYVQHNLYTKKAVTVKMAPYVAPGWQFYDDCQFI